MVKKQETGELQEEFTPQKLYMWVKGLESKLNNLVREVDLLKNDLSKKQNSLRKEMKTQQDDLVEVRHRQEQTQQKMDMIIKELKNTAGIEELMTLKKYVELWNPMMFVTQRDLERVVEVKLGELTRYPTQGTKESTKDTPKEKKA